ncbi:MAG: DUF4912 domain-containing protein [Candidatus Omnitrophica bacterium]|nr:DUF4912 domain-containing protein [Candidatus Omnitrophota bacterium]
MARKGPARPKTRKLASLVTALKAGAVSMRRRLATAKRRALAAAAKPSAAIRSSKPSSAAPVRRVSVVKKPAKGPTFHQAARQRSVVKKPARGPTPRRVTAKRTPAAKRGRAPIPPQGVAPTQEASAGFHPPTPVPPTAAPVQPAHLHAHEPPFSIPAGYGDNRIVLMVKDPWWLFAYWEIQPSVERAAKMQLLPHEVAGLQTILRVYDVTGRHYPDEPAHRFSDVGLSGMATNWYLHTDAPDRAFIVEIGLLTTTGRFLLLARSNRVTAPRFGPSDAIDEAWLTTDEAYWRLFGATAVGIGASQSGSAHILAQPLFSRGWSSTNLYGLNKAAALRGFWCRVNTDLVIHGAAEPRSQVTVQGQPVALRKDGTFSLRVTLPRGTQTITIDVTSPDGKKTTLTPVVTMEWAGPIGSGDAVPGHAPAPKHPELL